MNQLFSGAGPLRQRMFAWILARCGNKLEVYLGQYKSRLFDGLAGTVLEIGPGAGANLHHFSQRPVRWIGVEPNPFMRQHLLGKAAQIGMEIEVREGAAENLPAQEASVDAVVSTLVLCSVMDPRRAIEEVFRVLKPGGKFLFIEHVAAPQGTWLRRIQQWLCPLVRQMGDGCHPDRESWLVIQNAGFAEVTMERFMAPVPIVRPHIAGFAVKAR